MGSTVDCFSPLEACMSLSDTINTNLSGQLWLRGLWVCLKGMVLHLEGLPRAIAIDYDVWGAS